MKKLGWLFGLGFAVCMGIAFAGDRSPQEEAALGSMRQAYIRATGATPTADDEQKMLAEWKAAVIRDAARLTTNTATTPTPATPATPVPTPMQTLMGAISLASRPIASSSTISDEELFQNIAGTHEKVKVELSTRRDGLLVNGRVFADPAGVIRAYSYDAVSGDITYQIASNGGFIYKYFNPSTGVTPVVLGTAVVDRSGVRITLRNGNTLGGESAIPMPRGMLVARDTNLFVYEPGKAIQTVSIPDGWNLAQFQRGSVGATRVVLLESVVASNQKNDKLGFGSLISTTLSIGQGFGLNVKEDYAFFHLDTGKLIKLNIAVDGKTTTVLSNCRKGNGFFNECATATSYQSLYASDGGRNSLHYFWLANWYQTPGGPIAVVQEGGLVDVFIVDLSTGKRVTAFHRALGIGSTDTSQSNDGTVKVSASWMFQDHVIDDAANYLSTHPDERTEAVKN